MLQLFVHISPIRCSDLNHFVVDHKDILCSPLNKLINLLEGYPLQRMLHFPVSSSVRSVLLPISPQQPDSLFLSDPSCSGAQISPPLFSKHSLNDFQWLHFRHCRKYQVFRTSSSKILISFFETFNNFYVAKDNSVADSNFPDKSNNLKSSK